MALRRSTVLELQHERALFIPALITPMEECPYEKNDELNQDN